MNQSINQSINYRDFRSLEYRQQESNDLLQLACSRRSDSGERCEVKAARKNKSEGGGEVREGTPTQTSSAVGGLHLSIKTDVTARYNYFFSYE